MVFQFDFSAQNIDCFRFPYQYEGSNLVSEFTFPVNPKISFDDLHPYDEIPRSDFEEFTYKSLPMPVIFIEPTAEIKEKRTGAEEEY